VEKKSNISEFINPFEVWYNSDHHSEYEDHYTDEISNNILAGMSDEELVHFFYKFVADGGKIQSGGNRTKDRFKEYVSANTDAFRKFVLEPFEESFDLKSWFDRISDHKHFGVGIATIYLNRINKNKYSIINNKTVNALRKLGFSLRSTKSFTNYKRVHEIQTELINEYTIFTNYYTTDAFNHFLIGTEEGRWLLIKCVESEKVYDQYEQEEILDEVENTVEYDTQENLLKAIRENEKIDIEKIEIKNKSYKRNNYVMGLIKKYRNYQCQFCGTKILKSKLEDKEEYYIEACHIKAKTDGGEDTLDNILVLCPNCHKTFDYGKRENEKIEGNSYFVTINGKSYNASLS
jgi:predicted restriction endonuclease